eukprot:CAMPEP_0119094608 /NCGR_PEP_ID=MMETSP1178-20130426/166750_1 /TAXON_ID=33656 /ORGANISM="unid sp, Strain CCMP2000" /LENGTH=34 /DNA_ID= /DNA_START= /DNA_END= /DNA_ORIENTATION=
MVYVGRLPHPVTLADDCAAPASSSKAFHPHSAGG